jgi:hypothetical protein
MSTFAYELAQLGLTFALANSVSDDFEFEIELKEAEQFWTEKRLTCRRP